MSDPTPPEAAGTKAPGGGEAEPLAAEVSRAGDPPLATSPVTGRTEVARPVEQVRTIAPPPGPTEPPPPEGIALPPFISALQAALPDAVSHISLWRGDWSLVIAAARLREAGAHLRDTPGARFDSCSDVTATDWPPRAARFDVIYSLYSTPLRHRVRLKVRVAAGEA